jgi:hypothetical protein
MTIHAQRLDEPDTDVEVWLPTAGEWGAWVARELADLGISYDELERQHRDHDFMSTDAMGLWVIIGGSRPSTCRG